jgi:hypothetical protein
MGADIEFELDGLSDDEEEALLGRLLRRRRRAGRKLLPGRTAMLLRHDEFPVPDGNRASLPWPTAELMGLKPAGWGAAEFEAAIRDALSAPMYRINGRATFAGNVANEAASVQLQAQNRNYVAWRLLYSKSNPDLSITAKVTQAERYPLSDDNAVRLEAMFGGAVGGTGITEPQPMLTLLVPRQPLKVALVCEGAAPGAAHNVDFTLLGWLLPGEVTGGEASGRPPIG